MNVNTEQSSVPGSRVRGASHQWSWWVALSIVLSLGAGVFSAFTAEIGYYELHPGSARQVASLVAVGDGVETFSPASDIAYTTVSVEQSTAVSYVLSWFDDDVEILPAEAYRGDRSDEENRAFNVALMDTAKLDAMRLALVTLGYDVPIVLDGITVTGIVADSAADGVLEVGDTIVAIEGEPIDDTGDVARIMDGRAPGSSVTLAVERLGSTQASDVVVQLGDSPDEPGRGFIGVGLQGRAVEYQFPFELDIAIGAVGGPSAGLAFTLALLDVLTPGELAGGSRVAVTGTIDAVGNVGPVGGVAQKTAAVLEAGYDVFLVPPDEFEQATERAGDDLQVIAVSTLQQALDALTSLGGSGLGSSAGPA